MPKRPDARRRGFSFIEILFAVAVMGLGFIMVAAVFPVGLQQTKLNMDETTAAANTRGVMYQLNQLAQATFQYRNIGSVPTAADLTSICPVTFTGPIPAAGNGANQLALGKSITLTGSLRSFRDPRPFDDTAMTAANFSFRREAIWGKVGSIAINGSDPRNAAVLMYRRDVIATNVNNAVVLTGAPTAQIVVINVQANAQASYNDVDVRTNTPATPPALYNLEPRPVAVLITPNDTESNWTITFDNANGIGGFGTSAPSNTAAYTQAYAAIPVGSVAEGMFVVVGDDNITVPATPFHNFGRLNGHVYRVGVQRRDLDATGRTYQLAPGYEMSLDPGESGQLNDTPAKDDIAGLGSTSNLSPGTSGTFAGVAYNGTNVRYSPAVAYIVGRGVSQPGVSPTGVADFSGGAQDVGVYTTFLSIPAGQ